MLPVHRATTATFLRPFLPFSSRQLLYYSQRKNMSSANLFDNQGRLRSQSGGEEEVPKHNRFLNAENRRRQPSMIRELTKMNAFAGPDNIFMAGGLPNPQLFPFSSISVTLDDKVGSILNVSGDELRAALQYQPTLGYRGLQEELKRFVDHFYAPPRDWTQNELIVTVGSQNALCEVLELVHSPGDPVIVPVPCYTATLGILDPLQPTYLGVPEDEDGLQPSLLRSTLEEWYKSHNASPGKELFNDNNFNRPKILYVNPTGGNPSGIVIPTDRKKEIYRIAQEYDLLILEDDPYYFLHFLQEDPTTFLSLDVDGRVIRLDSFSKILSSGLRVGFAIGPSDLIRALELRLQASILHASSLSQVLAHGVLQEWGFDGFRRHTEKVREFYKRRRDMMIAAVEKHLTGLVEWSSPKGGMFLWLKVLGVEDTFGMVMNHGIKRKIMVLPGREFLPDKGKSPYIRLSFSVLPEEQFETASIRLAELINEERARQGQT